MAVLVHVGRVAAPLPHSARPRWHRLYFLLAAFDVLTVVLSLTLSHEIRGTLTQSVAVNQAWGQRLADYSDLGELAQAVDAPGNDVFDTLDVAGESAEEQEALRIFNARLAALLADMRANATAVDEATFHNFEQDFGELTQAMHEMTAESDLIFSYFARNQPEEAARRMATMDRKYANVHRALNELRRDVAAIQRQNFDQQQATAESLSKFEYVIAGFILLMVSAATVYGHKMAKRVEADARERKRAEAERHGLYQTLADRERALEDLIRKLFLAQEEERRRVAYEVHDGLAQLAAAAQQHLEAFASRVHPRSPEARQELAQARELAQQTVREARQVIAGLRPTALDDFGLAAAIRVELEPLRRQGWDVSYAEDLGSRRLPSEIETALFRVAQEALRNVRKHAETQRVELCLGYRGHGVRLEVRDWGRGFHPAGLVGREGPGERMGIAGMQERVALLGGQCAVHSRRGAGTRVVVEVPVASVGAPATLGGPVSLGAPAALDGSAA